MLISSLFGSNLFSISTSATRLKSAYHSPPPGYIKLNMDGAFDIAHGAAIGLVAGDNRGRVLGGLAQHTPVLLK
ncbi:hypothetical protein V6N13_014932 [Hibiscus sabdariffa]|uniref:RNase H type-1 domain-containing protein n=1 Tax=Hibiscus sabdariffa TaxID=183260 RepID=A0ABR2RWW6_9ROSI